MNKYKTYTVSYDENTTVRFVVEPDGTRLVVAADLVRAMGYQSSRSTSSFVKEMKLTAHLRQVTYNTRKRGVARAYCLPKRSVMKLLSNKCVNDDFADWVLNTVLVEKPSISKPLAGEAKPREELTNTIKTLTIERAIDKMIADLVTLRQELAKQN